MSAWPTLSKLPDQKNWSEYMEDPTMRASMEGGYNVSRARYTRRPRWTFAFQLTDMTNEDKLAIDSLLQQVMVGSDSFLFPHPFNGQTYTVRFNKVPKPQYAQAARDKTTGALDHHWDITEIELLEA